MDGREKTKQWVNRWSVADGSGRPHAPHGIWTSAARLTVYVCFDNHQQIGGRAFYMFTSSLQQYADYFASQAPIVGSHGEVATSNTGAGYLFDPLGKESPRVFIDRIEQIPDSSDDSSNHAVQIVARQLSGRVGIGKCRHATKDEQYSGVDLIVDDPHKRYGLPVIPVEVKSRLAHQRFARLFLQLSETNPEGRR